MASYKNEQEAFLQRQDDLKLSSLKVDLERHGMTKEQADTFVKLLFSLKVPQARIIEGIESLLADADSN